jgi:hypothetical protein
MGRKPRVDRSPEESSASVIPPPGRWQYKLSESKELVQYWHWTADSHVIRGPGRSRRNK